MGKFYLSTVVLRGGNTVHSMGELRQRLSSLPTVTETGSVSLEKPVRTEVEMVELKLKSCNAMEI